MTIYEVMYAFLEDLFPTAILTTYADILELTAFIMTYILVFSKLTALQAIRLSFSAVLKNISALLLYALIYLLLISICYLLIKFLDVILVSVFSQESVFASMVNFIARMVSIVFIASLSSLIKS